MQSPDSYQLPVVPNSATTTAASLEPTGRRSQLNGTAVQLSWPNANVVAVVPVRPGAVGETFFSEPAVEADFSTVCLEEEESVRRTTFETEGNSNSDAVKLAFLTAGDML